MQDKELTKKELKDMIISLVKENQRLKEIIMKNNKYKITFKKIASKYLSVRKNTIAISTYISYENIINNHLIKYFGEMIISDITPLIIEEYTSKKSMEISKNTVKKHHTMLNLIFKFAIKVKLISDNPMKNIYAVKTTKPNTQFYRSEDLIKLFFCMKNTHLYGLVLLCSLGLRRSEALAVKWSDINFENYELVVSGKIDVLNNYSKTLKNKSSHRVIVIPKWFLDELSDIKKKSISEWVCCEKNGLNHMTASSASHSFKYYIDKFNLKPITLKGLRHSCATLICSKGYNLNYVKDWLGHSTIKITADTYSHVDMSDKKEIAEKINSVFKDRF